MLWASRERSGTSVSGAKQEALERLWDDPGRSGTSLRDAPGRLQGALARLQNNISVDRAAPGTLQNIIFVDPAAPRALQNAIFFHPAAPGILLHLWNNPPVFVFGSLGRSRKL